MSCNCANGANYPRRFPVLFAFALFLSALVYAIEPPQKAWALSPPTITPGTGLYFPGPSITLSATSGATILFTTDGSVPTLNSQVYSTAFTINGSSTVNAIAVQSGVTSTVATATLTVDSTIAQLYPDYYNSNLWLRSDVGVTSSSGKVSNWLDISPQNHNASQSTSGNQPSFTASDYNGFPAISMATNQYFNLPTDISTSTNRMINPFTFFVTKPTGTSNGVLLDWGNGSASDNVTASSSSTNATFTVYTGSTPSSLTASSALTLGQYQLLGVSDIVGAGRIAVNGAQAASGSLSTPNNLNRTVNHLGSDYSGAANFYNGSFLEILSWGNGAPIDAVERYLLSRYQLLSAAPAAPIISVPTGTLTGPTQVAISTAPDCACFYTVDGSSPVPGTSPLYVGPIIIYYSQTLKAVSAKNGVASSLSSASYSLDSTQWPAPDPTDTTPLHVNVQSPAN